MPIFHRTTHTYCILHSAYWFRASHSYESRWLFIVTIGIIIARLLIVLLFLSFSLSLNLSLFVCVRLCNCIMFGILVSRDVIKVFLNFNWWTHNFECVEWCKYNSLKYFSLINLLSIQRINTHKRTPTIRSHTNAMRARLTASKQ